MFLSSLLGHCKWILSHVLYMLVPTPFQTHESFLSLYPLAPADSVLFVVFFIHAQNAMHIVREHCRQVLAFACSFESLHSEKVD